MASERVEPTRNRATPPLLRPTEPMMLRLLLALVAPSTCAACDQPLEGLAPALFCAPCAATVERADPARGAAFLYGGAIASAIARMKYGGRADLAPRLGEALAASDAVDRLRGRADLVVPVPLHSNRLAERGFNQAALLARSVARRLALPAAPLALVRVRETTAQAGLDRGPRLSNVRGAFRVRERRIAGSRVVLLDDVRTTGATLAACSAALEAAGVRAIAPLVLAVRDDELHGIRGEAL